MLVPDCCLPKAQLMIYNLNEVSANMTVDSLFQSRILQRKPKLQLELRKDFTTHFSSTYSRLFLPIGMYLISFLCGSEGRVQAMVASTSGSITFQLNYWNYSLAPSHKKLPCHCCNTASVYWLDAQDTLSVLELGSPARQNLVLLLSHWAGCHL